MRFDFMSLAAIGLLASCGLGGDEKGASSANAAATNSAIPRAEQPAKCPATGAALQVLGSGGPIAEADRAGTSYLLWIDGVPRLLIDAGAGSFLRYAQAGGKLATLDGILLTHLHADHAGDLPGILNSGGFETRTAPLQIIGPDAAPRFPGTADFVTRLIGKEAGAFAYNGGFADGTENKPKLQMRDIVTQEGKAPAVGFNVSDDISVVAHPVNHGPVPALGFSIKIGEKLIVITGDQSAQSEQFLSDLTGSKPAILFAHHVINGEAGQPRGLHRTPEQIGMLAAALDPARLVLTHNMNRSLAPIAQSKQAIAQNYAGKVSVAFDLDCYAL